MKNQKLFGKKIIIQKVKKKLKPILTFALKGKILIVIDSIAKYL